MAKRKKDEEPTETFTMQVNGYSLAGKKTGSQWEWISNVPGLARKHQGSATISDIMTEFMRHALAGATTAKAFMATFDRLPAEQRSGKDGE